MIDTKNLYVHSKTKIPRQSTATKHNHIRKLRLPAGTCITLSTANSK